MQIASHPNSPAATPQSMRASPPIGALSGRPGFRIRGAGRLGVREKADNFAPS